MKPLVLASTSPRRRALLLASGIVPRVFAPDVDEAAKDNEAPLTLAARLASQKCAAGVSATVDDAIVLAADTVVFVDNRVLGKPADAAEAVEMILQLQGRTHMVATAIALTDIRSGRGHDEVVTTSVSFRRLSRADAERYVALGESHDKAGAYAIQGHGAALVDRLDGSLTAVIGLPLAETIAAIAAFNGDP